MSDAEKQHIIKAFHFEIGKVERKDIRKAIVDMFNNVDGELARKIAMGVGVEPPAEKKGRASDKSSHGLSQQHTKFEGIKTRKIATIVAEGFNYSDLMKVKEALMNENCELEVISKTLGMIKGNNGEEIEAVKSYATTASVLYDGIYISGGAHIEKLKKHGDALHIINECFRHCKPIGVSSEGVDLILASDIKGINLAGKTGVLSDKGVVSSSEPAGSDFINQFKDAVTKHRHWDREEKEEVPA
jgi:catalase